MLAFTVAAVKARFMLDFQYQLRIGRNYRCLQRPHLPFCGWKGSVNRTKLIVYSALVSVNAAELHSELAPAR